MPQKRHIYALAVSAVLVALTGCGGSGGGTRDVSVHPKTPARAGSWWRPSPGVSWQWQLSGKVDTSVDASV